MEQTSDQILEEARKILKTNELRINKKGWAEFWCPAHPDEQTLTFRKRWQTLKVESLVRRRYRI
jgi:hypothetical protein